MNRNWLFLLLVLVALSFVGATAGSVRSQQVPAMPAFTVSLPLNVTPEAVFIQAGVSGDGLHRFEIQTRPKVFEYPIDLNDAGVGTVNSLKLLIYMPGYRVVASEFKDWELKRGMAFVPPLEKLQATLLQGRLVDPSSRPVVGQTLHVDYQFAQAIDYFGNNGEFDPHIPIGETKTDSKGEFTISLPSLPDDPFFQTSLGRFHLSTEYRTRLWDESLDPSSFPAQKSYQPLVVTKTAQEAPTAAHVAEAQAACQSQAETWEGRAIVRETIETLFIDDRSQPVDLTLCVVNEYSDHGLHWFKFDRASGSVTEINRDVGIVAELSASANGRYLAVGLLSEALEYLQVVDLPALLRGGRYKKIGNLGAFPGSVSIKGWDSGKLQVSSDVLLSHPNAGIGRLGLFADETFSWDFRTGKVTPLSDELRNPTEYYCARALSPEDAKRREAQESLGLLPDESAKLCLQDALTKRQEGWNQLRR